MGKILHLPKNYFRSIHSTIGQRIKQARVLFLSLHLPYPLIKRTVSSVWFPLTGFVPLLIGGFVLYRALPAIQEFAGGKIPQLKTIQTIPTDSTAIVFRIEGEQKLAARLQKDLSKKTPHTPYLVINTTENWFKLYSGSKQIREGICSTGSYTMLTDGKEKKWYFQTPKGVFTIKNKRTAPVWKKPDWAFVEEGLPVPSANHASRFEYGTLGDYALDLGYGYMIHGTLYQRFLGMPVTHGCVRLGDDNLKVVYNSLPLGAYVFIY